MRREAGQSPPFGTDINPFMDETLSNLKTQFVPRRKHSASVIKTSQLMLYRGIIAVYSDIHAKHTNALLAEQRISEC